MFSIPGKVCNVCGVWKPLAEYHEHPNMGDGHLNTCKVCKRAYIADWQTNNRDRVNASHRRGIEKDRAKDRRQKLESYYRHREKRLATTHAWQRANPDRVRDQVRRYRRENPEWAKITNRNNSLRRRNPALGSFTVSEWLALCTYYDDRCLCCDEKTALTADHIVPLSRGGMNTIDNIQPLCQSCNSKKNAKTIDYRDPDQDGDFVRLLAEFLAEDDPV